MKSTESDVCYFEVNAVFTGEPVGGADSVVELLDESTWTASLRRTGGNDTSKDVLCFWSLEMFF